MTDDNDFRVTATLREHGHAQHTVLSLSGHEVDAEVHQRLGHRVAVSQDGPKVFLYTDSAAAAAEAERVVTTLLAGQGMDADFEIDRWHPAEEEWEPAGDALPQTAEQQQAEHLRLEQEETSESLAARHALWEIRVELPSHHDSVALAERLQAEGMTVVRRWKFLIVAANNSDQADELAAQVRKEAPDGSAVSIEQAGPLLPFSPFLLAADSGL